MNKKYIPKVSVINYLNLGYKIGNTDWADGDWVKLYNDTDVIDEQGNYYTINSVTDNAGDYFIVAAPDKRSNTNTNDYKEYNPKWIDRVYSLYHEEVVNGKVVTHMFSPDNSKIMVIDENTGKIGISKCHPDDTFNIKKGIALAYARLRGMTPKYIIDGVSLDNLGGSCIKYKNSTWWVVPTPEVGTLIADRSYYLVNTKDFKTMSRNNKHEHYVQTLVLPATTIIPEKDILNT